MDENHRPAELVQLFIFKHESTAVQFQQNVCTVHHWITKRATEIEKGIDVLFYEE